MVDFENNTRFQHCGFILFDRMGAESAVLVIRGTFDIFPDGTLQLSEGQEPVCTSDEFFGEPGQSSVKFESDLALFKAATDVVLIGSAHSPDRRPVKRMDVTLRVGGVSKTIRVFGDREWRLSLGVGVPLMSEPLPFTKKPLIYERAFGGKDTTADNEKKHAWDNRNPVGVGFRVTKSKASLHHAPIPNLEAPSNLIRNWSDKPPPQSFGFIGRNWEPRLTYAGTYDESWQKNRMPLVPTDFDDRYFQGAHPDLCISPHLKGDERVTIVNASPDASILDFHLPSYVVGVGLNMGETSERRLAVLDTVIIRPDDRKLNLIWRCTIPVGRGLSQLRHIVASVMRLKTAKRLIERFGT